jgi:hypothetical protein
VNDYSPVLLAGGVAYAVVGAVSAIVPDRLRLPDAVGLLGLSAVAGIGAVAAVSIAFVTPVAGGRVVLLGRSAEQLALLAPVLFMFVVGALAVRGARARRVAVAGATLVLGVATAVRVDLASGGGTLYGLAVVLFGLAALAAPVVGAPLAALGAAAAGTSRS